MDSTKDRPKSLTQETIKQLVSSHRQFLSFVQKRVESKEVAEDILQTAFVRGLEQGSALRDEESAVAWFYRVLRNAIIDHYRQRDSTERAFDRWKRESASQEIPDSEMKGEICQCLSALVGTLKPEYQQAIQTIDLGGGTLNDLAHSTGITPGNAAVRIHRARQALRKQVRSACGTCAEHGCRDCHCRSDQLGDCGSRDS